MWEPGTDPRAQALATGRCPLGKLQDTIPGGGLPRASVRGVWG